MFKIDGNTIIFSNGKSHKFENCIAEALDFEDAIIVRLSMEPIHRSNENVYAFDYRGNQLWQIPKRPYLSSQSPYVGIFRKNMYVEIFNWSGYVLTLMPKQGLVITEGHCY